MRCSPGKRQRLAGWMAGAILLALSATSCSSGVLEKPTERMVNLGFEDVVSDDPHHLRKLAAKIDEVDATAVSISVGRADWVAFPWADREDSQAEAVRSTGRDYVAEAIRELEIDKAGDKRDIVLTIDALLDRALTANPELAGIDPQGQHSESFPSLTALRTGNAGRNLIELAATLASRYRPSAINLTELMFDDHTFGGDDLADFKASTAAADWPRTPDGSIDVASPAIVRWRAAAMAEFTQRVNAAVKPFGVGVEMDVRAPLRDASADRAESGHDYDLLLQSVDRLHVWEYVGLRSESSPETRKLAQALQTRARDRTSISVGLWSQDGVIPADRFREALTEAAAGGAGSVSVTPASLMTDQHWATLVDVWAH